MAYERRALMQSTVGRTPGAARIWVVDVTTRATEPLLADSQRLGTLPRWAPVGGKLAYYDPLDNAIVVLDTATGETSLLPSVLGDPGAWSPDAAQILYPELQPFEAGQYSQMLRVDLGTSVITPVMA